MSEPNCKNPYYDPGTDEHRAGRPSPPIPPKRRFPPRGRLARYVHARRFGYRWLHRHLLPNVLGPFYRSGE